jgi:hypothetical protein
MDTMAPAVRPADAPDVKEQFYQPQSLGDPFG